MASSTESLQGCRFEAVILSVSDIESAQAFYQSGLSMQSALQDTLEDKHGLPDDTIWLRPADKRGAVLGLTAAKKPADRSGAAKLVFYVKDVDLFAEEAIAAGGELVMPATAQPSLGGMRVGFVRGFDGQLIEFVGMPDASHSYLSAVGISVSDLELSKEYYLRYLAWSKAHFLSIPEQYDEYIMMPAVAGSSALVLMCWQPGASTDKLAPPTLIFNSINEESAIQDGETYDLDGHRLLMA